MSQVPGVGHFLSDADVALMPVARGPLRPTPFGVLARQRLATDSIGTTTLTLTNVVIGSAIRIEVASTGALVDSLTADTTTEVFTLPYYTVGSVNNDVRIKARKGTSAPKYLPFETIAVLGAAAQSVFIAQVADTIAA